MDLNVGIPSMWALLPCQTIDRILDNTKRIERSLQDQRRVVNDPHKQISTVTKGVKKQAC